jgi:hypothetical protein
MIFEKTEEYLRFLLQVSKRLERKRNSHSSFDVGFLKTNKIKLRSEATSLFDVQRWTFDVRCSVCLMLDVHF